MSWNQLVGHRDNVEKFRAAIQNQKLASTYLLVGPEGIGKKMFALKLAQALFCEKHPDEELNPCGQCPACQQVIANTHPDLMLIGKPDDKAFIPVELLIGPREKRMREGLCYDISRKPFRGGRKIAIIDDADFFNAESANALLKTLEEPPPQSLLLLLGTSEHRQMATIRSRSQVIRFNPLTEEQVEAVLRLHEFQEHLDAEGIEINESEIRQLARLANGNVSLAVEFADPSVREFSEILARQLKSLEPFKNDFAKTVEKFVDEAGKESAKKRTRMRMVCDLAIGIYREQMLNSALSKDHSSDRFAACIERCLDAQYHSTANMSPANLIETWLSDIGKLSRGEYVRPIRAW